ncbi:hypothetical protein TpMuguga_04g02310 [Theileria parva strain Muguga]|uniref:uncharacterized protein n=1 Tax=Theileria parva strain Muguga TaxID=333668 RepID=UPI001C618A50|nr:uncharacterized protein TpMuguga_04g02310 [Theileria parva strain Muguga]KAF5153296.1 hypothetical protein TpMuguga_04g02310 [Theileria parva strain Muguga]
MNNENFNKDPENTESLVDSSSTQHNHRSYLSNIVDQMILESDIQGFDERASHMLVDILQREALYLLKASAENSEKRLSTEKEKLFSGTSSATTLTKPNMKVTEEDAQLACQEYMNNNVVQPGILRDLLEVQRYSNNVRIGAKPFQSGARQKSYSLYRTDDEFGQFPNGPVPHLPENISINTLLPHWDIGIKENKP